MRATSSRVNCPTCWFRRGLLRSTPLFSSVCCNTVVKELKREIQVAGFYTTWLNGRRCAWDAVGSDRNEIVPVKERDGADRPVWARQAVLPHFRNQVYSVSVGVVGVGFKLVNDILLALVDRA